MNKIEDQYLKIIEQYPKIINIDNLITHIRIPIKNGNYIEIDYKKYPRKPKVSLINQKGEVNKKIVNFIPGLNSWKNNKAPAIIELINEIEILIDRLTLNEISIRKELLDGILALCQEHHPREILGLLRMEKNIVTEYILPPGALTSTTSGIFFPGRIPFDLSLKGTIHSHPTGNPHPSQQDLDSIFKNLHFHFITGYPYTLSNTKCYDRNGKEIDFNLI